MIRSVIRACSPLLIMALASPLAGCLKDDDVAFDAGWSAPDAGQLDAASFPDATVAQPDATVPDAETPDAGAPRRQLVERKLFGTMPVTNAVVDPNFDIASQNWYAVASPTSQNAALTPIGKRFYGKAPSGQAAAEMKKTAPSSNDVLLLGNVAAFDVPATGSVWIGRHASDGPQTTKVNVVVTTALGQSQVFELQPDGSDAVTGDDLVWQHYVGDITTAPVGISTFTVSDDTSVPYIVSGPTVVTKADKARVHAVQRTPTLGEIRALRIVRDKRYERMVPSTRARAMSRSNLDD